MKAFIYYLREKIWFLSSPSSRTTVLEIQADLNDSRFEALLPKSNDYSVSFSSRQRLLLFLDRTSYQLFVLLLPQKFQYWIMVNFELLRHPVKNCDDYLCAIDSDHGLSKDLDEIDKENLQRVLNSTIFDRVISSIFLEDPIKKMVCLPILSTWPRNSGILTSHYRVVRGLDNFIQYRDWLSRIWNLFLISFVVQDCVDYFYYPDARFGNNPINLLFGQDGNKEALAKSLFTNPLVFGAIFGLPFSLSLIESVIIMLRSSPVKYKKTKINLEKTLRRKGNIWLLWRDIIRWYIPFVGPWGLLNRVRDALIWDGRKNAINARERVDIFNTIIDLFEQSTTLARCMMLPCISEIAYGIHHKDIYCQLQLLQEKILVTKNAGFRYQQLLENRDEESAIELKKIIDIELEDDSVFDSSDEYKKEHVGSHVYVKTLEALGEQEKRLYAYLVIKTKALKLLRKTAREKLTLINWLEKLRAKQLLGKIGMPEQYYTNPVHLLTVTVWLAEIIAKLSFLQLVTHSVIVGWRRYQEKHDCEAAGKLWIYMQQVGDYMCTVCGDMPLPYKETLTEKGCLNYLHILRNASDVARLFKHFSFETYTSLDLSYQEIGGDFLDMVLPSLPHKKNGLYELTLWCRYSFQGQKYEEPSEKSLRQLEIFIRQANILSVSFSRCYFTFENYPDIGACFANSSIQFLELNHNNFSATFIEKFAANLKGSQIEVLQLSNSFIMDAQMSRLLSALQFSEIYDLDVSGNNFGNYSCSSLKDLLSESNLKSLRINKVVANQEMGLLLARSLAIGLNGSSIEECDCNGNYLNEQSIIMFSAGLSGSKIGMLTLNGPNMFTKNSMNIFVRALISADPWYLSLSNNFLDDETIEPFVNNVDLLHLTMLDMSSNYYIGDSSITIMADKLINSSLGWLELSSNNISDLGCDAIGAVLNLTNINTIYLNGNNRISYYGIEAFMKGLPGSKVQEVYFPDDIINDEAALDIENILPKAMLSRLTVQSRLINDVGAAAIIGGLNNSSIIYASFGFNNTAYLFKNAIANNLNKSSVVDLLFYHGLSNLGLLGIAEGLRGSKVKSLTLSNIDYRNITSSSGQVAVVEALRYSNLSSLTIYESYIDPEIIPSFAASVPSSHLASFVISNSYFEVNKSMAILLAKMFPASNLRSFTLPVNNPPLNDEHMVAFSGGLPGSPLEELNLAFNQIGDAGIEALAKNLVTYSYVYRPLWINRIFGSNTVITNLVPATNLTALFLGYNNITVVGMQKLCNVLPYTNISSSSLGLSNVYFPELYPCEQFYSAASRVEPPWLLIFPFRFVQSSYKQLISIFQEKNGVSNKSYNIKREGVTYAPNLGRYSLFKTTMRSAAFTAVPELAKDTLKSFSFSDNQANGIAFALQCLFLVQQPSLLLMMPGIFVATNLLSVFGLSKKQCGLLLNMLIVLGSVLLDDSFHANESFLKLTAMFLSFFASDIAYDLEKSFARKFLLVDSEQADKTSFASSAEIKV